MEKNNEVENKNTKLSNIHIYIVSAVLILLISFGGAILIARTVFPPQNADATPGKVVGPLYESPEFTVNIANSNGRRFLKAQFALEVSKKSVLKELEEKKPVFQDKVITILSSQPIEALNTVQGKEKIKQQIKDNLNEILSNGEIVNIYFSQFVWQ